MTIDTKILIPIIRKCIPSLVAQDIIGIQPMTDMFNTKILFTENPLVAVVPYKLTVSNEFVLWCYHYKIDISTVHVYIPDEETKILFKLRWCYG